MILEEKFRLSNGIEIPKLGLGTWFISDDDAVQAVKDAVDIGYRHIDTAQAYQNENGVGKGVKECGVDRKEIFVTTKVGAEVKSYKDAVASIDQSLEALGLDYIDLMIIHSPQPWGEFHGENRYFEENREVWKALEEAYNDGKLKAIGLSNFEIEDVKNIVESAKVKPMVNQVLAHIANTPAELIKYCQDQDIVVEAYSPIGHGELLKHEKVADMAKKYDVSVPQLGIRYCLQLGMVTLPKTANPDHMKTNADVDFEISGEDMETLKNMEQMKDYGEANKFPVYSGK